MVTPDTPRGPAKGGAARYTSSPDTTIAGYARVVTKYGDCNIIDYSATTRYKDYSVIKCDDCIVTRFTESVMRDLTDNRRLYLKPLPYQTTSLSLNQIQIRSTKNPIADDYGSNDAPDQSINSTILIHSILQQHERTINL